MRRFALLVFLSVLLMSACAAPPTPVPPTATNVPPTAIVPTATPHVMSGGTPMSGSMPMSTTPMPGKVMVGTGTYTNLSPEELKAMLDKKDFVFVNVHYPYAGEIANTDLFIPSNEFDRNMDKLPKDKGARLVLYCRSGMMSTPVAETLVKSGYTNVFNLLGGMNAWTAKQFPLLNNPK